jgi:triosephosphate isomerase
MRIPLLAGNWKMYKTIGEAEELVKGLLEGLGNPTDREVAVCPPFTALAAVRSLVEGTPIALGAQDLYVEKEGAFTGEVAPPMLKDAGCTYVIVGHSERRQYFDEDDALVNRKLHAGLASDLRVIICVGESKPQRDAGQAESIVINQVRAGLAEVSAAQMASVVIAYEPIWAIGTGDTCAPDDAQAMHAAIRRTLTEMYGQETAQSVRIQYGGSVKPGNVDELMAKPDIDGALVGGASLKAADFLRIVQFQ